MTMLQIAQPVVDAVTAAALPSAPRRALFLDRDGVINVDHGYVHSRERTDWMPGIFDLVAEAVAEGLACVVVTNQAGIARGFYDEAEFSRHTEWVHSEFRSRGAPLLATYHCPHHPEFGANSDACACRKPAPGMLLAAIADFGIDASRSLLIGDKPSDIEAAMAAGVGAAILVDADADADEARNMPRCLRAHSILGAMQLMRPLLKQDASHDPL